MGVSMRSITINRGSVTALIGRWLTDGSEAARRLPSAPGAGPAGPAWGSEARTRALSSRVPGRIESRPDGWRSTRSPDSAPAGARPPGASHRPQPSPTRAWRLGWWPAALGLVAFALAALVTFSAPAQAQTTVEMSSNLDKASRRFGTIDSSNVLRQAFTTGVNGTGYVFQGVALLVEVLQTTGSNPDDPKVTLHAETSGAPGTELAELIDPSANQTSTSQKEELIFAAASDVSLDANTTYWVVVTAVGTDSSYRVGHTTSTSEDTGGLPGWSIADRCLRQIGGAAVANCQVIHRVLQMAVRGYAKDSSNDATLSGLGLASGGTAVALDSTFSSTDTSYLATVKNPVTSLTVTPTTSHSGATVEYLDGDNDAITDTVASTEPLDTTLDVGANIIRVKVTAEDGVSTKTYTVTVTRESVSTDATLSGLALADSSANAVSLSPTFAATKTLYRAAVANSVTSLTVTPTTTDDGATVAYFDADDNAITDQSTDDGLQATLTVGRNVIKVKVTAEDTTTETYTVEVARAAAAPTGTCDALWCANLTLGNFRTAFGYSSTGQALFGQALAPATFNIGEDPYIVERVVFTDDFGIRFDTNLPAGVYRLDIGDATTGAFVSTGLKPGYGDRSDFTFTGTLPMDFGEVVSVKLFHVPSDDATLSGLALATGGTAVALDSAFSATDTSYRAAVANSVTSLTVTPTASDDGATFEYFDVENSVINDTNTSTAALDMTLDVGANVVKVKVTSEDDSASATYTVTVARAAAAPTAACDALWCANLTAGVASSGWHGYATEGGWFGGALAPNTFDIESTTYTVLRFYYDASSSLFIFDLDRALPEGTYGLDIAGAVLAVRGGRVDGQVRNRRSGDPPIADAAELRRGVPRQALRHRPADSRERVCEFGGRCHRPCLQREPRHREPAAVVRVLGDRRWRGRSAHRFTAARTGRPRQVFVAQAQYG